MDKPIRTIIKYWIMVLRRAFDIIWTEFEMRGLLITSFTAFLLAGITTLFIRFGIVPSNFPLIGEILNNATVQAISSILAILLFFVGVLFSFVYVPAKIHMEQNRRLELKVYDDINFKEYLPPETTEEARKRVLQGIRPRNNKLYFLVQNNGNCSLYRCLVTIQDIQYYSDRYDNTPKAIETKPLKWAVGFDPNNGTIELGPRSFKELHVAIAEIHAIPTFKFVFLDGVSGVDRVLLGTYRIVLKIEGTAQKENFQESIIPILFELTFDFNSPNLFSNVSIKKLPRDN